MYTNKSLSNFNDHKKDKAYKVNISDSFEYEFKDNKRKTIF